jgi:hypothetical protein
MVATIQAAGLPHRRLGAEARRATCCDLRCQQPGDRPWKSVPRFTWAWTSTRDSISVAAADPGRGAARLIGKVAHDVSKLLKVLVKIDSAEQLHIVYEAGPTEFGLQRAS